MVDVVSTESPPPPPAGFIAAPQRAQKRLSSGFCWPHWVQNTEPPPPGLELGEVQATYGPHRRRVNQTVRPVGRGTVQQRRRSAGGAAGELRVRRRIEQVACAERLVDTGGRPDLDHPAVAV